VAWLGKSTVMTIRKERRRAKTHLVIDISYAKPDGTLARYRRDAQVQTMASARAEERRLLATLAHLGEIPCTDPSRRREPSASCLTFAEASQHARETKFVTSLKPSTRRGYNVLLDTVLLPRFGEAPLEQVTRKAVAELDAELVQSGLKPSTRRNIHVCLRSVLRTAADDGLLEQMPQLPRLPRIGATIVTVMTSSEVNRLIAAATPTARLAFRLAAYAGLRAGEVRGLRWPDVDLIQEIIVVRRSVCRGEEAPPKSGHHRVLPIATPLLPALVDAARQRTSPWAPVSPTADGKAWAEFSLRSAFREAARRAGLSGWSFHSLRHYFVTSLFQCGAPAPVVQALAGHMMLSTTQRYAHVNEGQLKAVIARLHGNGVETESAQGTGREVEGSR
jgi:integrase